MTHNFSNSFLASFILTVLLNILFIRPTFSQCSSSAQYPAQPIAADNSGSPQTINTCVYAQEFSAYSNVIIGNVYSFSASGGNGNYITIRQNNGSGAFVASGFSPLTGISSPISGTLAIVLHSDASCGTDNICHTVIANCTSCGAPQIPGVPSGVTATANSSSQITLTWTAISGASSYQIDQATNSSFTGLISSTSTTNSYVATGLASSTTYFYRVRALNSAGPSGSSTTVSATTQSGVTAPGVPSGVTATANSSSQITLNWTAVSGALGYFVDQATNSAFSPTISSNVIASTNSMIFSSLASSTTYFYRVRASNSAGTSLNSATASATTQASGGGGTGGQWTTLGSGIYHFNSVHIGKTNTNSGSEPDYKLFVAGGLKTEKFKLELGSTGLWADYVFDKNYNLMPIDQLSTFIKDKKHLPGFPSEKSILLNKGYEVGDMIKRQQEAIEQLHLYIIELENRLKTLELQNSKEKSQRN
jgi:hypothetical protein